VKPPSGKIGARMEMHMNSNEGAGPQAGSKMPGAGPQVGSKLKSGQGQSASDSGN
jgi:hypothetical protein